MFGKQIHPEFLVNAWSDFTFAYSNSKSKLRRLVKLALAPLESWALWIYWVPLADCLSLWWVSLHITPDVLTDQVETDHQHGSLPIGSVNELRDG